MRTLPGALLLVAAILLVSCGEGEKETAYLAALSTKYSRLLALQSQLRSRASNDQLKAAMGEADAVVMPGDVTSLSMKVFKADGAMTMASSYLRAAVNALENGRAAEADAHSVAKLRRELKARSEDDYIKAMHSGSAAIDEYLAALKS